MSRIIKPPLPTRTLEFAKELRKNGTDAENLLWFHLRAKRFHGFKWRRQHPVPPYIVDFYCHVASLAVELDGGQHGLVKDAIRTAALDRQGLRVLRFWDHDVLGETQAVLDAIFIALQDPARSPSPSPGGRGEPHGKQ